MPSRRSKKDSPAKGAARMKRRWRVVLLRNKGETLGQVEAPDVASAKAAAAVQFIWTKSNATGSWCRSLAEAPRKSPSRSGARASPTALRGEEPAVVRFQRQGGGALILPPL